MVNFIIHLYGYKGINYKIFLRNPNIVPRVNLAFENYFLSDEASFITN